MSTFIRFIASGPGALVVTTGLGLLMANLIKVPFTAPDEKSERLSFVINEVLVDEPIPDRPEPPALTEVAPPPAQPKLDYLDKRAPIMELVDIASKIPPFIPPVTRVEPIEIVMDQTFSPIYRQTPIMPARAERSGHCDVMFDVNADGATYNVRVVSCSQTLFARASTKAAYKWKYRPQTISGQAQDRRGVRTTITFNLIDEHGNLISE